jgi:hypothetical protein
VLLATVVGCGGGGTEPVDDGRLRYVLSTVDGAALPAVYFQRGDTTARVYADTLVFTPRGAGTGSFSQAFHLGMRAGVAAEQRFRRADENRGAYDVVGGQVTLFHDGGGFRGGVFGADQLVLDQALRQQRWVYRRAR